jgi:hypothetical protein
MIKCIGLTRVFESVEYSLQNSVIVLLDLKLLMKILTYFTICLLPSLFFGQSSLTRLTNYRLVEGAQYGWSCATNGDFVVAGGPSASYAVRKNAVEQGGKVAIYKPLQGKWIVSQTLTNPAMDDYGWFGNALAMNEEFLVVASSGYSNPNEMDDHAHREGKVYVYQLDENELWQKKFEIGAPIKNKAGEFGKSLVLRGDTLAVFYETGEDYYGTPDHHCIAFYNLKDFTDKPLRVARFQKNEVPIFRFKFDFNQEQLLVSQ